MRQGALARLDQRSAEVQALKRGAEQILEDTQRNSFIAVRMAHRLMHLDQLLARDELRLAEGGEIDRERYLAAAQVWLRFATTLGLQRAAKPVKRLADVLAEAGQSP
jgi:hypothetical protein